MRIGGLGDKAFLSLVNRKQLRKAWDRKDRCDESVTRKAGR